MAASNANVSTFRKIYYRALPLAQAGIDKIQVSTTRQIYANASSIPSAPANGRQGVSTMRKVYALEQQSITVPLPLTINNVDASPRTGINNVTTIIYTASVSGGFPFLTGAKYKYKWNWTNGTNTNSSGGVSPNITFAFPGVWTGTVMVTDSVGNTAQGNVPPVTITGSPFISISGSPSSGTAGNSTSYVFTVLGKSFNAGGFGIANQPLFLFTSANPTGPWTEIASTTTAGSGGNSLGQYSFTVQINQGSTNGITTYYEVSDTNPPS